MVPVAGDGFADEGAPKIAAEGVGELVLGALDGLGHGLGEIGESAGGARFDMAFDDGDEEASEGGVEIAGREIFAGEEVGDVAGETFSGEGLSFFAGVEVAEVRVFGGTGSAAAATVGESEGTEKCANVGASGHGNL